MQGRIPAHMRFSITDFLRINYLQSFDPIFLALLKQRQELRLFLPGFCDDQFSGSAVGNTVLGTKFLCQAISLHTVASLPGICRIVDAGMDDAAVARAGRHAEFRELLNQEDILPAAR